MTIALTQLAADLQSVDIGQGQIEHQQVVGMAGRQGQGAISVSNGCHRIAPLTQQTLQGAAEIGVVFHDQQAHRGRRGTATDFIDKLARRRAHISTKNNHFNKIVQMN
jgi:hypothetical protein